jgi:hypothetical protein
MLALRVAPTLTAALGPAHEGGGVVRIASGGGQNRGGRRWHLLAEQGDGKGGGQVAKGPFL